MAVAGSEAGNFEAVRHLEVLLNSFCAGGVRSIRMVL